MSSKPKFSKSDRRLFYAQRQYQAYLLISELSDIARQIEQTDERMGRRLCAIWMALYKVLPISQKAQQEARNAFADGQRSDAINPKWLETAQERRERRIQAWREQQASKAQEQPQDKPQTGRDRPSRRAYRERFAQMSPEERQQQLQVLRAFLGLLLGASCQAEEQPQEEDDDGSDLDPDVWGDVFGDD